MNPLPSIEQAVDAFFSDFDFGEDGERTCHSYRSGERAFLRFTEEHKTMEPDRIEKKPRIGRSFLFLRSDDAHKQPKKAISLSELCFGC
jgi:hypothetical protein